MPIGSNKQKFYQLGIETYFKEGRLKKMKCIVMFQYSICDMHLSIMRSELVLGISVEIL